MENESNNNQIMTAVKDAATNAFIANCKAQGVYMCEQEWLCNERCRLLNGFKKRLQENLQSYFGPTVDGTINPSGHVAREANGYVKAFSTKDTTGKNVSGWFEDENGSRHLENWKDAKDCIFQSEKEFPTSKEATLDAIDYILDSLTSKQE